MAAYASGLTYEQLRAIVDAGAIDKLTHGTMARNGKRYQAQISYRVPVEEPSASGDGEARRKTKRVYLTHTFTETQVSGRNRTLKKSKDGIKGTKDLLSEWRDQVISDARRVAQLAIDPTKYTVRDCVNSYIDNRRDIGKIRHSTETFYRNAAKRIYRYPLASMPIQDLTKPVVQSWVSDLSKRLAYKTVKSSLDLLDAACKEMIGHDNNPCNGVTLPRKAHNAKRKSVRPNALSLDGWKRCNSLMDERIAKSKGTDYVMLGARIAMQTGMRAEEVTGLRWRDVDLPTKTIHVRNVIERAEIPEQDEHGNVVYDSQGNPKVTYSEFDEEPKTDGSVRDIPLTPEIVELLTAHERYVRGLISELVPDGENPALVKLPKLDNLYVLGGIDGRHMSPHRLGANWGRFARSRKIIGTEGGHVTFHDLRHSFATRSIAYGIDVAAVSRLLGHADINVTFSRYVTSDEQTKRAAIDRMAEIFSMREEPATEGDVLSGAAASA